jgi:hypothetical protein
MALNMRVERNGQNVSWPGGFDETVFLAIDDAVTKEGPQAQEALWHKGEYTLTQDHTWEPFPDSDKKRQRHLKAGDTIHAWYGGR